MIGVKKEGWLCAESVGSHAAGLQFVYCPGVRFLASTTPLWSSGLTQKNYKYIIGNFDITHTHIMGIRLFGVFYNTIVFSVTLYVCHSYDF